MVLEDELADGPDAGVNAGASGAGVAEQADAGAGAEDKSLLEVVQSRLEELLSKQNLAEDAFVQQHMNAQMYIPFVILVNHRSFGDLNADVDTLRQAAKCSSKLGVDEDGLMVRPLLKPRRNTLILRDLPEDIPEQELRELFEGAPEAIGSLKPDVNNTAFVTFKTDEGAQTVALWLRSQKLRGTVVKCSMKSEHFLRSFFPATAQTAQVFQGQSMIWGAAQPWGMGTMGWQLGNQVEGAGYEESWTDPSWVGGAGPETIMAPDVGLGPKGGEKGKRGKGKGKGRRKSAGPEHDMTMTPLQTPRPEVFTPMMGPQDQEVMSSVDGLGTGAAPAPAPTVEFGYKHEFRKYTRQQIIEVCNAMDEISKPDCYQRIEEDAEEGEAEERQALFRQSPCKDWAPLATPQMPFASNFFDGRRSSEDGGDLTARGTARSRKSSSWSRGSRQSRSQSTDVDPATWAQRRSWDRSWDKWDDTGWDDWSTTTKQGPRSWAGRRSPHLGPERQEPHWEPKGPSWAEKVKGAANRSGSQPKRSGSQPRRSLSQPRWQEKTRNEEAVQDDATTHTGRCPDQAPPGPSAAASAAAAAAAAPRTAPEVAPKATPEPAADDVADGQGRAPKPTAEAKEPAKASPPTWADKVRQAAANSGK